MWFTVISHGGGDRAAGQIPRLPQSPTLRRKKLFSLTLGNLEWLASVSTPLPMLPPWTQEGKGLVSAKPKHEVTISTAGKKSGVYSQSGCSCGSQWCLVFWYSKWELRCWHCWALKSSKCFWHSSVLQSWYSKLTPGQSWPPLMGLEKRQHFKGWLAVAQRLRLTDAVLLAKSQHV